jgi:vitamin B12/bleomycin/antimicrobial peptide transport system ATP-binding/permease protein
MNRDLIRQLAKAPSFLGKLWRLAAPYWWNRETAEIEMRGRKFRVAERWIARGLLALVLFLNLFIVWILKLANDWNARFFNALEERTSTPSGSSCATSSSSRRSSS